jgi:hypothetical protein
MVYHNRPACSQGNAPSSKDNVGGIAHCWLAKLTPKGRQGLHYAPS